MISLWTDKYICIKWHGICVTTLNLRCHIHTSQCFHTSNVFTPRGNMHISMYMARCENIRGVKTLDCGNWNSESWHIWHAVRYIFFINAGQIIYLIQLSTAPHPFYNSKMVDESYEVLCEIKSKNKVFRKACSQIILLNHQIESSKTRYDRAKQVRRLSFRYTNRLKLTALEGVRNLTYEFACTKCEEIEILQARLLKLTGDVFDFAESDTENWAHSSHQALFRALGSSENHTFSPKRYLLKHSTTILFISRNCYCLSLGCNIY